MLLVDKLPFLKDKIYSIYILKHKLSAALTEKYFGSISDLNKKIDVVSQATFKEVEPYFRLITIIKKEIQMNISTGKNITIHNLATERINQFESKLQLYLKLNNGDYEINEFMEFKLKNIVQLSQIFVENLNYLSLLWTTYPLEVIKNYNDILEIVIETKPDKDILKKILPLGIFIYIYIYIN